MALNLANVVLTDTFNTWRVRTNDVIAAAFEVESATPTTVTTSTTFGSNTTLAGANTVISSNLVVSGSNVDINVSNVDIVATVDINNSKIRIVDNDMTITGELTANSFTGDGSALTAVDAATLDSIDSASFLRSDAADAKTTGDLTFNDNIKALFGTAGDLEIYHSGSASLINDAGGGNLKIQLGGSDKLEVTGFGLDATGKVAVSGDVTANAVISDIASTDGTKVLENGTDGTNATFTGDVTGNADTATALETARDIAGQSFDGTANISIGPTDLTGVTADATEINKLDGFTGDIGFRNIPPVGTKTGSYSLATGDVGKYVQVGSGGSITIPDATFSEGDAIVLFNNTTGNITVTCSITTAYIAGDDTDVASVTLATRGVCNILFANSTVAVLTGNIE